MREVLKVVDDISSLLVLEDAVRASGDLAVVWW